MFEFLSFIVGIMIMGPIVYIYFSVQELKKELNFLRINLKINNKNINNYFFLIIFNKYHRILNIFIWIIQFIHNLIKFNILFLINKLFLI